MNPQFLIHKDPKIWIPHLYSFSPFKVTVTAKVLAVEEQAQREVRGKTLQFKTVLIADETSSFILTLWEQAIAQIKEGGSYNLRDISVREFDGKKSVTTTTSTIIEALEEAHFGFANCAGGFLRMCILISLVVFRFIDWRKHVIHLQFTSTLFFHSFLKMATGNRRTV